MRITPWSNYESNKSQKICFTGRHIGDLLWTADWVFSDIEEEFAATRRDCRDRWATGVYGREREPIQANIGV